MPLRSALRLARYAPPARPAAAAQAVRSIASSAPRRGGHDDHAHDAHGSSEADTTETFLNSTWRNTFIIVAASALIYPFLPSPSKGSASPSLSPEGLEAAASSKEAPWLTRWIAGNIEKAETWSKRNDKHLELTKEVAETKLLFQEAERPKVWRLRYPSSFEQASPHAIPVGSQVDLRTVTVKPE